MSIDPLTVNCPYCMAIVDQPCQNQRAPGSQKVYSGQSASVLEGYSVSPTKRPHPERVRAARATR